MSRPSLRLTCLFWLFAGAVMAQSAQTPRETALQFLRENPATFKLTAADVADVRVTDNYLTKHNGVTHVWLQQQYVGIPVFNGLIGLHVKADGGVVFMGHRFVAGLAGKINTTMPSLSASKALEMAMANLGFTGFPTPSLRTKINERNWVYQGGAISRSDIPVSICYAVQKDGLVRLAWTIVIDQANTSDNWSIRVDAQTGKILDKINHTVYCKTDHVAAFSENCSDELPATESSVSRQSSVLLNANETYNVYPLPIESPAHGNRQILVNPADPIASPFGWLDVDGATGPEYTYTRGNNVWAYNDIANDNIGTPAESAEAGPTLNFNFPFDPDAEPAANRNAALTNLFYLNNTIHDVMYHFGFDEDAGNFQVNNYNHGGVGGDPVFAEGLDGAETDNANFAAPPDGFNGKMQMYLWNRAGGQNITVNAPAAVTGQYFGGLTNGWGQTISATPVTGNVEFVDDGSGEGSLGCGDIINNVNGKIAMVDRGICEFGKKALNAQQAGAIGCIICDHEDPPIGGAIGPGAVGAQVTIPVVWMKKSDCNLLRQFAGTTLSISLVEPAINGPNQLDGDFDNGIMSHEFSHGTSIRLTGGPANSDCLSNTEQMGEGWSDFFALAMTAKPGDIGTKKRGMGTYVNRQLNDGTGFRRYPYSTDMGINPLTFSSVAENTEVHALGEVWAAVTWDLYWAFVEKYGYDANLSNTNSGNFRAIQLVTDGLKLQPCGPGFIDGRNAIRMADMLNYNGADTCLISSVFARRGLGYFASQGSSDLPADGIESFDPIPTCVKELKIKKITTSPLIDPQGFADYQITVTNHKDGAVTNVVVTDELPAGLSFVSATNGGVYSNGMVVWNLGTLASLQVVNLSYRAQADPGVGSLCLYRDPMDNQDVWSSYSIEETNFEFFSLQNTVKKVGTSAWEAPESVTLTTDFVLEAGLPVTISGNKPVFRFWHQFNTENASDAGFIEVQIEGESTWKRFSADKMFRNPYSGKVQYGTFAIPGLVGFSGNSNGWQQSFLDVSDYVGKKVFFRFRFGTDDNTGPANGATGSWYVDEVQLIDMVNFEGTACVASAEGDQACSSLTGGGVVVNTSCGTIPTVEPVKQTLSMLVQPNPAHDLLHITLNQDLQGAVQLSIVGSDGRVALSQTVESTFADQVFTLDVQNIPAGIYLVRMESANGNRVAKVVIH